MLFETIVGPIHSRRLGSSLGINLLPQERKLCTYDWIYCECGWNSETEKKSIKQREMQVIKSLYYISLLSEGFRVKFGSD